MGILNSGAFHAISHYPIKLLASTGNLQGVIVVTSLETDRHTNGRKDVQNDEYTSRWRWQSRIKYVDGILWKLSRYYLPAVQRNQHSLQWRHNERDGVSNRRPLNCLSQWPMDSTHKGPVTRKMFPFDGVITIKQFHRTEGQWCKDLMWWNFVTIWVRSRNCGCLVTWFCYQLIAKLGNKTAAVSWPDPYDNFTIRTPWVKIDPHFLFDLFCGHADLTESEWLFILWRWS